MLAGPIFTRDLTCAWVSGLTATNSGLHVADRPAMTHRADGRDVEEGRRVRRHEVFAPCEDVVLGQG